MIYDRMQERMQERMEEIPVVLSIKRFCHVMHLIPPSQYEIDQILVAVRYEDVPRCCLAGVIGDMFATVRGWEIR